MMPPLPFRGDAPDRGEAVLRQAIAYNPAQWLSRLPDPGLWPDALRIAPAEGEKWPVVDRATVLDVAAAASDPAATARAYLAAAVWGTGTNARGVARRCKAFVLPYGERASIGDRLASVVQVLRDPGGGPVAAYQDLHGDGRNTVKHLGPAFGTKFLYFSGFDRTPGPCQPLILDSYVVAALNRLGGFGWPPQDYTTAQYARYLDLAHRWAGEWGTRPDVVERVLFAIGRSDPYAIEALTRPAPALPPPADA